ncbi:unnamed protein product [Phytophthora fragariaefolia]|uniref:Unnamed protein product n=1 Tax=Phytophthora fragariaefolia TaxID=1490495 RepID=A0A9W6WX69_9STRA|nr:unnamed protein product [Phytophthora fragariaefolia]
MASTWSSSSSSGAAEVTPSPRAPGVYARASENVCMWTQQSSDACDSPRSCYDCLNAAAADGTACVISSAGLCTTMAEYVWQQDYRLNASAAAPHYFPAANASYCEDGDAACEACAADQFVKSAAGTTEPSQFCVGARGCVCVGFCESPVYESKVSSQYCATLGATASASVLGVSVADIVTIVVLCFAIPVAAYLWWVHHLRKRRLAREEARRNRPPVNGPLLPLVGWKKYCADLKAKQTPIVGTGDGEAMATPTNAGPAQTDTPGDDVPAPTVPLSNLQVATLSIEFEDPQHPLTAVTSTGRRRSSIDNTNVVRPRPSQPISINEGEEDEEDEEEEMDVRSTPYARLGDRTA